MPRRLSLAVISVFLGIHLVYAQVTTGTISGVVQDASGGAIADTAVTVRNLDTGTARTVSTDAGGRYTIPDLPVGNYEIQAQHPGFQTEVRSGVNLTVGREALVNVTLKVGQVSEKILVTGEAPIVESTTSAMSALVDERTIRDLPLNGRSYDQLALIQPGVVSMGAGQASAAFDFGTGTRFSVAGSRPYANSFLLDGTDINDHANGTPGGSAGTNLGVDAIQEFKINTSVSPAEYGRSSGGVVSAVTRPGTNSLHGEALEFIRNNDLDSLGYFDQINHGGTGSIAPFRRNQFGGNLGGPIKKDKTFFFGAYEGLRQGNGTNISPEVPTAQTLQGIVPLSIVPTSGQLGNERARFCTINGDSCYINVSPAVKPYLALFQAPTPGLPTSDLGDGTGFFFAAPLQVTNEDYFMNRLDHQISEKMRLFLRYSFDNDSNVIPNVNGSSIANEQDVSRRQYSTIQATNVLRPSLVNSVRVAYNRTYQNFDDVVTDPRAANLNFLDGQHIGTISFGGQGLSTSPLNFLGVDNGAPRIYWYNLFQAGDDLTYVKGKQSLKMGVNVERIDDNEISSGNSRGDYTFLDIPSFLANVPIRFDAPPANASDAYRGLRETLFGAYVQDDVKVNRRLTLNLGLRYEFLTDPKEVNGKMADLLNLTDPAPTVLKNHFFGITKKDFEPRVGLAWQLNGSGKTVLRSGFAVLHDHIFPYAFATASSGIPPFFKTLSDLQGPTNQPVFPRDTNLLNGPTPPLQFGSWLATNKEPSKIQYNLTLQQQVMKDTVLEAAFIGSESHHLQRNGEWNTPVPISPGVFPAVFNQANRINPNFGSLTVARWDSNADYDALQITLRRRAASGLQYQVFYTYSKSIDQKSTLAGGESRQEPNTVLDFQNRNADRGLSAFDARHNFVLSTTYPLPFHFQQKVLGGVFGGWTVNGIGTFRSGEPLDARVGSNVSANGDRWFPDRPNLKPGFSNNPTSGVSAGCMIGKRIIPAGTPLGTPSLWYDPCAFSRPAPGTYGNLGRNTMTGPGLQEVDASLEKVFKPIERMNIEARAEVFNLLDHANFYIPGFNVFAGSAGVISRLISYPGGRIMQFGLKLHF
jgi:Carboxypeptidase regulatory-like domain/TonB dependent receptor/TonB-dependent Receptor Plug Domain